jgi:uncharacterized protein
MQQSAFHIMTKPVGPLCNLGCTYCFYLEKERLYPDTRKWEMPPEVLETYIREYIRSQSTDPVTFAWQGGEPTLLGVDFFERVIALQAKYAEGKRIQNALQTNGTLLDNRWGEFLARNNILVGLSIDGPRELHDYYRVDKGATGTFDRVIRGLEVLKEHKVEFNTLTVVNRHNSTFPLDVYRFLKQIGSRFMQFIPVVERKAEMPAQNGLVLVQPSFGGRTEVTDWSVEPLAYGHFLSSIFDEWVKQDVGTVYIQHFDVALESWLGMEPSLCVFGRTCGSAMALEHGGDLYSCDHYVYPENRLGNIMESNLPAMADSPQQKAFGQSKLDTLPQMCRNCSVRFACNGECPKHRFLTTPDGEPGLNYLCAGYKHFFSHIDPFMQFMAQELRAGRAPANVMQIAGSKPPQQSQRRNALCNCGSGLKAKKCCLKNS